MRLDERTSARVLQMPFATAIVAFLILMSQISSSHALPERNKGSWLTKLRYSFKSGTERHSLSASIKSVDCLITIYGADVVLNLVENEHLSTEPPVFYTNKDGHIAKIDAEDGDMQRPKYLQDTNGRAAVALWKNDGPENGNSLIEIDGVIFHDNETYRISPIRNLTKGTTKESEFDHELTKTTIYKGIPDYVLKISDNRLSQASHSLPSLRRSRRAASAAYEVDLLYVLDYSTYQKFFAELSFNGSVVGTSSVVQQIRFYYSQVSNLVDLRYKSITAAPFTIRTKLTALYIVMSAANSTWTESISISGGQNGWKAINASAGLSLFTEWIYGASGAALRSSLPSFDHAVLFTSYDLYSSGATGPSYVLIGLAYLGGICTAHSTSIVENTGALTEASTTAHELGHSLGAVHDGENNACQASDQYVMSAVSRVATESTSQNYFTFSSCSVANFMRTISTLTNNCLSNANNYFNATEWLSYMEIAPGQIYSPNVLCRQAYGNSFEACGGVMLGSIVCLSIYCYNTSLSISASLSCTSLGAGGRGIDGTTCGNHRWCQKGTCAYNTTAPPAIDDCPIGDYARNSQVYSNVPHVCSNMPSEYCYDERVYNICCATCNKIKDSTRPGCEYGDRTDCSGLGQSDCPLNLNLCCRTCDAFIPRPSTTTAISTSGTTSKTTSGTKSISTSGATSISTSGTTSILASGTTSISTYGTTSTAATKSTQFVTGGTSPSTVRSFSWVTNSSSAAPIATTTGVMASVTTSLNSFVQGRAPPCNANYATVIFLSILAIL